MKKNLTVIVLLLALVMTPAVAFAASAWSEESTYVDKIVNKLDYGIKNLLGGWTEIVTVPYQAHQDNANILEGLGRGMWNAVAYTAGGVVHTATFLCPQIDIDIKDGGVQF